MYLKHVQTAAVTPQHRRQSAVATASGFGLWQLQVAELESFAMPQHSQQPEKRKQKEKRRNFNEFRRMIILTSLENSKELIPEHPNVDYIHIRNFYMPNAQSVSLIISMIEFITLVYLMNRFHWERLYFCYKDICCVFYSFLY